MNDWALITGASAGIGRGLAGLFAAGRFNLVLVARGESRLELFAAELRARHGVHVKTFARDLAMTGAATELFESLRSVPVQVLVNNAGLGWAGDFAKGDLKAQMDLVQVNVIALVELTHLFLGGMLTRGNGRILNVASLAAFQPGPSKAVYYATKAFVYSFSNALAEELADTGIVVSTLCPGPTRTEFHTRARMRPTLRGSMSASDVALAGYRGLMRGQRVIIPGRTNQFLSAAARVLPSRSAAAIVKRLNRRPPI